MPGIASKRAVSSSAIARRSSAGLDPEGRGRDEHGAAGLSDGERGTGVDADERFLERDGIGTVRLDEARDCVEDRLQP